MDPDDQIPLQNFSDQEVIFNEGDVPTGAYIINKGRIVIYKVRQGEEGPIEVILSTLTPGEIFGDIALIEDRRRSASARTEGPTELFFIRRDIFEYQIEQLPAHIRIIIKSFSRKVRQANTRILELTIGEETLTLM